MSASLEPEFAKDLRAHLTLCQEAMVLSVRENQALMGQSGYSCFEFYQKRKDLLPRLEESLMALRNWRNRWQQASSSERESCSEVKALFQSVQTLLMKALLLDRENQQALLRHGLLPAQHLPSRVAQQPHCVADVYRRHSRS
jgi:hypothetical protein